MEYLLGYFLADGYMSNKGSHIAYTETKDKEFADNLSKLYGCEVPKHRKRTVKTGTQCDIYTVKFNNDSSEYIRTSMNSYKDFRQHYSNLSEIQQDDFMHGFFDGDGTICIRNGRQVFVGLYAVEDTVREICQRYLDERGIKYTINQDKRGKRVTCYTITKSESVLDLMLRWRQHRLLTRKDVLFIEAVKTVSWVECKTEEKTVISADRKWLSKEFNIHPGVIGDRLRGTYRKTDVQIRYVDNEEMVTLLCEEDEQKAGEPLDKGCVRIRINNRMLTANQSNDRAKSERMGVQTIES